MSKEKDYKHLLRTYFKGYPDYYDYGFAEENAICEEHYMYEELGVHKLSVEESKDAVTIHISLTRPGIFIGKQGKAIDHFRQYIEKETGLECKINITEFEPITNLEFKTV